MPTSSLNLILHQLLLLLIMRGQLQRYGLFCKPYPPPRFQLSRHGALSWSKLEKPSAKGALFRIAFPLRKHRRKSRKIRAHDVHFPIYHYRGARLTLVDNTY